jgi:hypothetical protein
MNAASTQVAFFVWRGRIEATPGKLDELANQYHTRIHHPDG